MPRFSTLVGVLALVSTPLVGAQGQPPSRASADRAPARPNVVLIIADDLGYGDLGSYGAPDIRTPNLDRLAKEGVRLTDYYANAPVCTPTRAALITGRYQQRVMLDRPLDTGVGLEQGLPVTGRSLPQLVKNAGYATALIGKWHLGFKPEFHPNRHGFDAFWGYLSGYLDWYTHVRGDGQPDLWENGTPVTHQGYFGHEVTKRALKFVEDHARSPFFLEVAYGAPHWPFQSPHRPSVAARRRDQPSMLQQPSDPNPPTRKDYIEIVEDADAGVGQVLAALERHGIARNTLVIFVSDNGGEWLSRNAPFFDRKDTLWEGGIRVPAILRWPGVLPAGKTAPQVAITMDLSATILAAVGADTRDAKLEGIDLVPLLKGSQQTTERTLFWRNRQQSAVRSGDWKLLVDGGQLLLFDVRRDAGERRDMALQHPDTVQRLQSRLQAWEKDVDGEAVAGKKKTP
jgi:arylsulfatase A-like enzyme